MASSLLANAQNVFVKTFARTQPPGLRDQLPPQGRAGVEAGRQGRGELPRRVGALRAVRNTFTAYRSTDGITWVKVGRAKVNMGPTVLFGLAAASQSSSAATTTAHFDGLSEVTEAYVMIGKRRVPQRLPGRAIARDPKPVTEATIAVPREESRARADAAARARSRTRTRVERRTTGSAASAPTATWRRWLIRLRRTFGPAATRMKTQATVRMQ